MLHVKIKLSVIITTKPLPHSSLTIEKQALKKVVKTCKTLINAVWISYVIQSPDSVAVFNPASLKMTLFCMFFDNGTHTFAAWTLFPSWMVFHVIFNLQFNLQDIHGKSLVIRGSMFK